MLQSGSSNQEMKLREELLKSKKELTQLKFQYEQITMEIPRLKVNITPKCLVLIVIQSRIDDLQQYIEVLRTGISIQGNTRTSIQVQTFKHLHVMSLFQALVYAATTL